MNKTRKKNKSKKIRLNSSKLTELQYQTVPEDKKLIEKRMTEKNKSKKIYDNSNFLKNH